MVNRPGRPKPKKRSGGFSNYAAPSFDSMKKIASQKGGRFDSIFKKEFDSWRAKEGPNQIRVLPPTWDGYEHYAYEVFVHKNVGSDNSTYLCLNKNRSPKTGQPMGLPCPICNAVKRMKENGEADAAKEIQVTQQYVSWIVDRDAKKEFPPLLWAMSWTQNRDIVALSINERTGKTLAIAHAEEGYDIQIKRFGTQLQTKYTLAIDREESTVSDDEDTFAELEEFCNENPVPSTLKFYPAEYLENIISGAEEEEDEELDDKPKKKRSRDEEEGEGEEEKPSRSKRRGSREEEEEDEDTEEDKEEKPRGRRGKSRDEEEEEEEEDEKPKRGVARRKLKKPADEDEEDGGEEDDTAEEEEPKTRKTSRRSSREDEEEDEEKPRKRRRSDEDETEESEDEDEKPRRKVKSSSRDEDEEDEKPRRRGRR